MAWTEEQARALVPDAGTWQRGQQLAAPAKWANLGRTATAAWGECAGSGAKPYLTGIALTEPAFKCSCPSRVFPCKHGAGLLLLLARQPALLPAGSPPAWLTEWLEKRQQTQDKKVEKLNAPAASPAVAGLKGSPSSGSPSPQEKEPAPEGSHEVAPARLTRMAQGAADLETWLLDLVRGGLASLDQQPRTFWESQAARLVDNQLPGLAATVRELAALRPAHAADWPARLLGRLGELYWLVRAFQNRENLPADARWEVWQQVGITVKKEDLPALAPPVADRWQVLGQLTWEEERLTARRSWLRGQRTGRYALVLDYAFGSQPFATPLLPNARYDGELAYYPGLLPIRAAPLAAGLKFVGTAASGAEAAPPGRSPAQLLDKYADALALNPWLREWPATLAAVVPGRLPDGRWVLRASAGPKSDSLPLPLRLSADDEGWQLLALSGGHLLTVFGEWDGQALRPLGSWPAPENPSFGRAGKVNFESSVPENSALKTPLSHE